MTDVIDEGALRQLYDDFAAADLKPLWTEIGNLQPEFPQPDARPHRWAWARPAPAGRTGRGPGAGRPRRRAPGHRAGQSGARRPAVRHPHAVAAIQYLGAGEVAPSHRHAQGAFRFVVRARRSGRW